MLTSLSILRFENAALLARRSDEVACEEPLQICVQGEPLVVAMRTPGQDCELAAGWLLSEGIVRSRGEIADIVARPGGDAARAAMVDVMLAEPSRFEARGIGARR